LPQKADTGRGAHRPLPALKVEVPAEDVQQRALAGAVDPDEADAVLVLDLERHLVQDELRSIVFCDIFQRSNHFAVTPDLHKIPVFYDTISSGKRKPPARTFPAKA